MKNYKNIKSKRLIIVFIPGMIIITIILFFVFESIKCKTLLEKDNCLKQMVFAYYSKEHIFGNGTRGISTGFILKFEGEKYKVTTNGFANPIPKGIPIIIRFSPQCPDCYQILWDSIFVYNNVKYQYFYIKGKGYDCNLMTIPKK